jgi:hypothetical protein
LLAALLVAFGGLAGARASEPAAVVVADAAPFVGVWQLDWERSEGVSEMLKAQGVPGVIRWAVVGSRIRQRIEAVGEGLAITVQLPVGKSQESWVPDGVWRPQKSRMGDHRLRVTRVDGGLQLERAFTSHTVTEQVRIEDGVLTMRRTLVRGDVVTRSVRRMARLPDEG